MRKWQERATSAVLYGVTTLIGVVAFLYPFWLPAVTQGTQTGMAHAEDAPLVLTLLVGLAFAVLLLEVQSAAGSAKMVALLGVLVAINSVLRFAEAAVPGPGGFSPVFVLMILGGYVFGARVGFLLGVLTLLVSALVTGGVGPWLPYQMFTAGWVGMSAPLCRPLVRMLHWRGQWGEVLLLALLGGLWGLVYGVVMNLWFWPYAAGSADLYWTPGSGLATTVQRYVLFYMTTSLVWDGMRAIGTVLMIAAFGGAILRVLNRFHARFAFTYAPLPAPLQPAENPLYRLGNVVGHTAGATVRELAAIHGLAWLAWLGALLTLTTTTRNPWYLGLGLLWVAVTEAAAKRQPLLGRSAPIWSPLRFGLLVVPLTAVFNALTVHIGATELWRLPLSWPLLGGAITLEALLYGALNGVALTILFGAFAVVNRMMPLRAIIHLIPRTYYPVAIVAAIAITFVPVTLRQWHQIREAQAVRGHRLGGIRSWLALWLPLLTSGMERALQLAEAMTARGFAGGAVSHSPLQQGALVGGLVAVLAGLLLRTVWEQGIVGLLLIGAGAGLVLGVLYAAGRQHPHTRYRPMPWRPQDWLVVGGALVMALAFLLPVPGRSTIFYTPYPALSMPGFAPALGVAMWGLLAPVVVWVATTRALPAASGE